jgi:thiol-disulfide isomerase/thioredoxin
MKLLLLLLALALPAQAQSLRPFKGATPPLELNSLEGKPQSLEDFRGRVVLVNFWASWCAPCLEEMPSIEKLRRSLDAQRFAVVAVNVGEGPARAAAFVEKMGIGGFHVLLDREVKTS